MGKKDLSITSPTSSPDRFGSLEEGMQQSGKNLLLPEVSYSWGDQIPHAPSWGTASLRHV